MGHTFECYKASKDLVVQAGVGIVFYPDGTEMS